MFPMTRLRQLMAVSISAILFISCSTMKTEVEGPPHPMEFEKAISDLADYLLDKVKDEQNILNFGSDKIISLEPFIGVYHGDTVKASREIEAIIIAEGKKKFSQFIIKRMASQELDNANYRITGIIDYKPYNCTSPTQCHKFYIVEASVRDLKGNKTIAKKAVWISDTKIDTDPIIPRIMDTTERGDAKQIEAAKSPPGTSVPDSTNYDKTKGLLVDATTAYENQDYDLALSLFDQATKGDEGQRMEAYAGLYQTNMALGKEDEAGDAYKELIDISINNKNKLTTRFLFEVGKVTFPESHELEDDFPIWLHKISHYLQNNNRCFVIEGHCSKSGDAEYNKALSLRRAEEIQRQLQKYFPRVKQKTKVVGKGFDETLVGLGTDDIQDELDRRVEFEVVDCEQLGY